MPGVSELPRLALLPSVLLLAFALAFACSSEPERDVKTAQTGAAQEPPEKPNVLVIITDDQDVNSLRYMPRLQKNLVERGTTFANSFATTATCCPSRASFLTGRYSHNHRIYNNYYPVGGAVKFREEGLDKDTIATRLEAAGYRTAYAGKYLNQYRSRYIPSGWDEWYGWVGRYDGGDDAAPKGVYQVNENGTYRYHRHKELHETDYLSRKARAFVRASASEDEKPWFLVVAPNSPHAPTYVADRHRDLFTDVPPPTPESFDEADVSDKAAYVGTLPRMSPEEEREVVGLNRKRLRSLQPTDEMVGRLVSALERTGQMENTYIVYASDNGYQLGEHRIPASKGGPYEEGAKVPLVVRGPGVEEGRTREELVANIDWGPTIADWAGTSLKVPDGRSLAPLLAGAPSASSETPWRNSLLLELIKGPGEESRGYRAIRTEREVYVEYQSGETEYYDLSEDPYQLESRPEDAPPELVERLDDLKDCSGDECRKAAGG